MNINMSWTERQGQVGDLTKHSKQDLQELLLRQEKILSNTRLIQTLPDKGEKIKEFAVKIQQALKHHEEAEIKQKLVSEARMGFQSKYQQAFTMQQRPAQNTSSAGDPTQVCFFSSSGKSAETTDKTHAPETGLVEAMERVTLSNGSSGDSNQHQRRSIENYFMNTPAKPHYLNVIEKFENIQSSRKSKFKTNQLPSKDNISPSGSSSPSQSSRTSSPLSAQARRERDRKHLDDITAAKLPPLHNSPAQLLSLEESAILLKQQTKKQQELQAKLAAQKLSEGLKISMGSYTPDGGPMAAYREVHDEGAQLSSEED
ncbi:protein GRINL1A [Periophthalmus magnuspinnatus]|uniref:protein GRINL1A n=1 Tax=Periophthalmus magnuspinnatus TaxID=409849 RepID=UPI00145BCA9F|nr:protein GRINL1A [Periophthalmus magnuspinnatus]